MKSLALTAAIALGLVATAAGAVSPITTLDPVEVRPSAEQWAERDALRIATLPAVQVRPSAAQIAERAATGIVTLATVEVRPSAMQRAELDAIPTLAAVQVRPSIEQVAALHAERQAADAAPRHAAVELVRRMVEAAALGLPLDMELATGQLRRLTQSLGRVSFDPR